MSGLSKFNNFHLVGIKGVAMTSLAQILLDMGKKVTGVDVQENFVTQNILDKLNININFNFNNKLPENTDCVIYTAAHKGPDNPQVKLAKKQNTKIYSQAEALAELFNQKQGIAVCGVGGKSTVTAMVAFILNHIDPKNVSFSVGVGNISGLNKTGQWSDNSKYFVAEADEYVTDPAALKKGQALTPRFSYLRPFITICTNLQFDHPDVYQDLNHTKQIYLEFFKNIKPNGVLIINADDQNLTNLVKTRFIASLSFGQNKNADFKLVSYESREGETQAEFKYQDKKYKLKLIIPGKYNIFNALAAIAACYKAGVKIQDSINILKNFKSTKRRFEYIGQKNNVKYYDDYAHHPREIKAVIKALAEWFPNNRKIICFQSHTFSRTKKLFNDFVDSFAQADQVLMIDIFASARESYDDSVSSDLLCQAIAKKYQNIKIKNLKNLKNLAEFLKNNTQAGDVVLTVGAGDIYQVHELIKG